MSGIVEKVRVLSLAEVHGLLDKVIDLNSPKVLREYVREIEQALDSLHVAAADATAATRPLVRRKSQAETEKTNLEQIIRKVQQGTDANKDETAKKYAVQLVAVNRRVQTLADALQRQTETAQQLDEAVKRLDQRHKDMVARLSEVEVLDQSTVAKMAASKALTGASKAFSMAADASVDSVTQHVQDRADRADVRFEQAMSDTDPGNDPEVDAEASRLLEQLK